MNIPLAYVPLYDINTAFEKLANELSPDPSSIIYWFEDNCIWPLNRVKIRKRSIFSPLSWSVYARTIN